MEVRGDLYIGEAARWAPRACSRITGHPWPMLIGALITLAGAAAAAVLATVVDIVFAVMEGLWSVTFILLLFASMWPSLAFLRRWQLARARRALIQRGVQNPLQIRFEVGADVWTYLVGSVETRGPWSAISEVFPVGPYWVLMCQGTPQYLAKRHFPDADAEQAFLQAVLARLTPEAKARSKDAARFAEA